MFHGESLPRGSEASKCFTASLFLAGRSRLGVSRQVSSSLVGVASRRVSSSQVGVVWVFQCEFLLRRSETSGGFTASLSLAGWSRLGVSQRVSSSQVGAVYVFHGESILRRSEFC